MFCDKSVGDWSNRSAEIKKLEADVSSSEQKRITLLHQYNDVKDAAQVVIGVLASKQGVSIRELHEKYNLPVKDA